MKVRLTIDLDVPGIEGFTLSEARQLLFDAYTHYVTCQHHLDAVRYCASGRVGSDNEDEAHKQIFEYHKSWAAIASSAVWDMVLVASKLGDEVEIPKELL